MNSVSHAGADWKEQVSLNVLKKPAPLPCEAVRPNVFFPAASVHLLKDLILGMDFNPRASNVPYISPGGP